MSQKIVVTGIGATTPIGATAKETWQAALKGVSGVKALDDEWAEKYQLPVRIAAPVKQPAAEVLEKVELRRYDPSTQLALIAAREAWADAGTPAVAPERFGVDFATGIGGVWTLLDSWDTLRERGPRRVLPLTVPMLMPNAPAAAISMDLQALASARTTVSACASSTESLVNAVDHLRSGLADVIITGGTEAAIHPLPLAAFAAMKALSPRNDEPERASRPYDADRDGFVLGEGAGALVLETEEHAKARGARIYAEIASGGVTSDAYHITAPDPEGRGASRAVELALQAAGAKPEDVAHINAHATSTPVGDIAEYVALKNVFGDRTHDIPVTATKSQTGHLLGAAGAVEAILTVLAVAERTAPVTINVDNQDPEIPFDVVTEQRALPTGDIVAISNSFGFGGHNAVVAVRSV